VRGLIRLHRPPWPPDQRSKRIAVPIRPPYPSLLPVLFPPGGRHTARLMRDRIACGTSGERCHECSVASVLVSTRMLHLLLAKPLCTLAHCYESQSAGRCSRGSSRDRSCRPGHSVSHPNEASLSPLCPFRGISGLGQSARSLSPIRGDNAHASAVACAGRAACFTVLSRHVSARGGSISSAYRKDSVAVFRVGTRPVRVEESGGI